MQKGGKKVTSEMPVGANCAFSNQVPKKGGNRSDSAMNEEWFGLLFFLEEILLRKEQVKPTK